MRLWVTDQVQYMMHDQLEGRQNKWVASARKELDRLGMGNIWAKEWEIIKKCEE
jgi:hypothetical protein